MPTKFKYETKVNSIVGIHCGLRNEFRKEICSYYNLDECMSDDDLFDEFIKRLNSEIDEDDVEVCFSDKEDDFDVEVVIGYKSSLRHKYTSFIELDNNDLLELQVFLKFEELGKTLEKFGITGKNKLYIGYYSYIVDVL